MLKELIATALDLKTYESLREKITEILVDHQLNICKKGNVQKDIQALIREALYPQVQDAISKINSEKELKNLYEAYTDCVVYGTSQNTSALDHNVDAGDLAWLLSYKRLPQEELSVSKALKKKREKK